MNKIKILFFEQIYTKYVAQLAQTISSDEFDVTYLACITTKYWQDSAIANNNYNERKIKSISIPIKKNSRGTHYEVFSFPFLINLFRIKPDILVIDPNPGLSIIYLIFAKAIGCKTVGFTTNLQDVSSFWGKLSNFILKRNDGFIDKYVVPSSVKKQMMIDLGINKNKINVIGHGIDTKNFKPETSRRKIPTTKKIILFVGRFVSYKGIKYLIEGFDIVNKTLNDTFLVLIGDGPEKQTINQLINEKKLSENILQINNVINSEMPQYYSEADIIVVPSIKPEPFGLVYIEGMASGKPIVTFDAGGGEKDLIINEKNGLLVKLEDVNGLASAMLKLLSDDELRKEMGLYARKFVEENYDFQILASHWSKIIRDEIISS